MIIKCQRCKPEDRGCGTCGGYKKVMELCLCRGCKTPYWSRPGVFTSYIGKTWYSVDGLKFVQGKDGVQCANCPLVTFPDDAWEKRE